MKVELTEVYKVDAPKDWRARERFHFEDAKEVKIYDYNEFGNHCVVICSNMFPLITYKDGNSNSYKCRHATKDELKEYCKLIDNKFYFPQVQENCVNIGRGVWD